ncbi:hypothetical protein H4R20_003381 [Coemansia guatemalensis]|uniref:Uncharacterized protein n=1 Tax=Coemansia guatemalensis TaxID=2761395 RepID=A0A9W8I0P9_9FUNG|nr:hypothetical protein H4R20_003381 [Coemansia guatemalensis]
MASLTDSQAAAQVRKIAADLSIHETHILTSSLLRQEQQPRPQESKGYSLSSAFASLWQTQRLFQEGSSEGKEHVYPFNTQLLGDAEVRRSSAMVWLGWDECRSLFKVFRSLEYVDAAGKPTSLVDSFVARLAEGGTAGPGATNAHARDSGTRRRDSSSAGGGLRLWGWNSSSNNDSSDGDGTCSDEQTRSAAWMLISRIFAQATALRVSAEAEEVSEGDGQAVLTWFPQLEYLEIEGIPRAALRFWDTWLAERIRCLKIEYAGLDLQGVLGDAGSGAIEWQRLALVDLSGNAGIDLAPLRGQLTQQLGQVARLSLARCELDSVPDMLAGLYQLSWLDLHDNRIVDVADISLRVGGVVRLNLAQNQLASVAGLRRVWALEVLDISDNVLAQWTEVAALRNLPSLRELHIKGNPFTQADGYRAQVFSAFDHRDVALVLDGHGPTTQERRDMARIPRVATENRAGVPMTGDTLARRAKVAVIEEAADDDDAEGAEHGRESFQKSGSTGGGVMAEAALEKTPRVLRASELQAVSVASAHRRSNVAEYTLGAHGVAMKLRGRSKRRATATTVGGATGLNVSNGGRRRNKHACSVPGSYSSRPSSPAPSSTWSVRMGTPSLRDPERYRRRVEMMRAEAGSSWLRAFAELQLQSPQMASAAQFNEPQLPVISERQSDCATGAADGEPVQQQPKNKDADAQQSKEEDTSAVNGKLPSFLFPRRKNAERKREIARLPHYPKDEQHTQPITAEVVAPEDVVAAGLAVAADDNDQSDGIGNDRDDAEDLEEVNHSKTPETLLDTEAQRLLRGDGVSARAEDVQVSWFKCVPMAASGGCAVQRSEVDRRTLAVTPTELVCISDGDAPCIGERVPLAWVVRVSQAADVLRMEVKGSRLEMAQWFESRGAGLNAAGEALQTAAAANAKLGLAERVFRQAECLRCGWRGFVDTERDVFALLDNAGSTIELPPPRELHCPQCGRNYIREFYAGDESAPVSPAAAQADAWKQSLARRRSARAPDTRRGRSSSSGSDEQQRQRHAQQIGDAHAAVAEAAELAGAVASECMLPFGEATNAIRLFLQLSVFEAADERLVQWVPAGLVYQTAPVADGRRAQGKWGLTSLLGTGDGEGASAGEATGDGTLAEQAAYIALSTHALYAFVPSQEALQAAARGDGAQVELQPELHLTTAFAVQLAEVGRVDVGPSRQYVALHAGLLGADGARWNAARLKRLAGAAASCVVMVRDRLVCSDVLDALVQLGYEARAGGARRVPVNHDVEWAMHHLARQVLLRPAALDAHPHLRRELLRSRSARHPGAMADAAATDVIIDKVTYEFLKLYFCVGRATRVGIEPVTLAASPNFLYVVRERVDVWPPPVPDLHLLYRQWQRAAPPTIVTSDPDTYDPHAVTAELARRSAAASAASSRTASAGAEPAEPPIPADAADAADANLVSQLSASAVDQYDSLIHARPAADLRRVTLVLRDLAVFPSSEHPDVLGFTATGWRAALRIEFDTIDDDAPNDETAGADSADKADNQTEVDKGDGEIESDKTDNIDEDRSGWCLWFATVASARECSEALVALARNAGASDVTFCES